MRALPVRSEPLWRTDFRQRIAVSLWFLPTIFAVAAIVAASQYSPRTVRIFIRSRITRVTLGLFLATFVFSVIILVSDRASVPSAAQFAPIVSVTTLL
ncbi:MAG: DUF2254 family protein, partial [Trebonia sp.]